MKQFEDRLIINAHYFWFLDLLVNPEDDSDMLL
jgi:hypothetical protein